jgi:hypothetical protein
MDNQGIPGRTLFGGEDSCDCLGIESMSAEPVDSFGWKGDEATAAQDRCRAFDRGARRL